MDHSSTAMTCLNKLKHQVIGLSLAFSFPCCHARNLGQTTTNGSTALGQNDETGMRNLARASAANKRKWVELQAKKASERWMNRLWRFLFWVVWSWRSHFSLRTWPHAKVIWTRKRLERRPILSVNSLRCYGPLGSHVVRPERHLKCRSDRNGIYENEQFTGIQEVWEEHPIGASKEHSGVADVEYEQALKLHLNRNQLHRNAEPAVSL